MTCASNSGRPLQISAPSANRRSPAGSMKTSPCTSSRAGSSTSLRPSPCTRAARLRPRLLHLLRLPYNPGPPHQRPRPSKGKHPYSSPSHNRRLPSLRHRLRKSRFPGQRLHLLFRPLRQQSPHLRLRRPRRRLQFSQTRLQHTLTPRLPPAAARLVSGSIQRPGDWLLTVTRLGPTRRPLRQSRHPRLRLPSSPLQNPLHQPVHPAPMPRLQRRWKRRSNSTLKQGRSSPKPADLRQRTPDTAQ